MGVFVVKCASRQGWRIDPGTAIIHENGVAARSEAANTPFLAEFIPGFR
jgi:hypothetical protein